MKLYPDNHLSEDQAKLIHIQAGEVFTPRTPISNSELFAGRWTEINQLVDAVNEVGLHVVLYGERGVGKTSLANVIPILIEVFDSKREPPRDSKRIAVRGNANSTDTFSTAWEKVFDEIYWTEDAPSVGFRPTPGVRVVTLREAYGLINRELTIEDVRRVLAGLPGSVFVIDEFDRLPKPHASQFTDLIKALADSAIDTTVMLVGVAETVDDLVRDHASIPRALIQIPLHPMKLKELRIILENAERKLQITFEDDASDRITFMSQGRPHYTHLVGLLSVRAACERRVSLITIADVSKGFEQAVQAVDHTISKLYDDATYSSHSDALWKPVLLACAVAAARESDPIGYFSPSAVVEPLSTVLGRQVQISTFNGHLGEFCEDKRSMLGRTGQPRGYRYRFRDPLVPPYVLMRGVSEGMIRAKDLNSLMHAPKSTVFSTLPQRPS
ncbi:MAG: ATP-binding protein [Planctomycetota bacterium]|nr:MAG: ATP-binding protein [Planctomycetota bacterium]